MLVGHVGRITPELIGGWAADTDAPNAVVDVIIYVDGKRVARVSGDHFRQDLRDLEIYGEGRHGFQYHMSPPLPFHVLDRVTVRYARSGAVLPDGERHIQRPGHLDAILVTAPGRSGTTVLMGRLAQSPQICVAQAHPFEVRLISYWATVARTLASKPDYQHSMHPDHLEGDGYKVGSNPFSHADYVDVFRTRELESEYFGSYVPDQLLDLARQMIGEYYSRVRDDQQKPNVVYLAEKSNNLHRPTRDFARALYPRLKEIIVIRDPRDLLCSHVSYFRRSADEAASQISEAAVELMRIRHEEAGRVMFVRYEDMVMEPEPVYRQLAEYLGVETFGKLTDAGEMPRFRVHGTSESPKASVARWQAQLSAEQQLWCNSNWREILQEFGYI
jgi:hypothetical protein